MNYEKLVLDIIRRYGVVATKEDGEQFTAFLQPLKFKNYLNLGGEATALGYDSRTHYLCLTGTDSGIEVGQSVVFDDESYCVVRAHTIFMEDAPCYLWAILKKGGKA